MIKQVGLSQCQRIVLMVKCSHSIFIGYSCTLIKSLLPCGSLSVYLLHRFLAQFIEPIASKQALFGSSCFTKKPMIFFE